MFIENIKQILVPFLMSTTYFSILLKNDKNDLFRLRLIGLITNKYSDIYIFSGFTIHKNT